jgi:hypothetical protein
MTVWLICAVSFVGTMLGVFFVKKILNHPIFIIKVKLLYFYFKLMSLYWTRNIKQRVSEKLTFPSAFSARKKSLSSLLTRALSSMAVYSRNSGRALHYTNEGENSKVQGFAFQHLANELKKKTFVEQFFEQKCLEQKCLEQKCLEEKWTPFSSQLEFLKLFFNTEQVRSKKLVAFIISEYIFGAVDIAAMFYAIEKKKHDIDSHQLILIQKKIRKIQNNRNKLLIKCGKLYVDLQEIHNEIPLSSSTIQQLVECGLICENQHTLEYYPEEAFSKKVDNERPISNYLNSLAKNIYNILGCLQTTCEVDFNEPSFVN